MRKHKKEKKEKKVNQTQQIVGNELHNINGVYIM